MEGFLERVQFDQLENIDTEQNGVGHHYWNGIDEHTINNECDITSYIEPTEAK